jgi:hypothetical protein
MWRGNLSVAPFYPWEYNGAMDIVNFPPAYQQIGASGICPHCSVNSYFRPVAIHLLPNKGVCAVECEACKRFGVVIGARHAQGNPFQLAAFYPIGKPDDEVDKNVPTAIAEDFAEALRCHWIKAHRACVVMCRRAIQSSALELLAKGGRLIDQIDDLFTKGKITESLKDFAHEVRLTGNDGAHPDKDGLKDVSEPDANDIVEFTREYLHHVYVMPAKLKARKSPSPAGTTTTTP